MRDGAQDLSGSGSEEAMTAKTTTTKESGAVVWSAPGEDRSPCLCVNHRLRDFILAHNPAPESAEGGANAL